MKIQDLEFEPFISSADVQARIAFLAEAISRDYAGLTPVFLPVLNGSFMFAADLIRKVTIPCRVSFVKIASYVGMESTGDLRTLIGHEESLFNQDLIIVEDIVDSGLTLRKIMDELRSRGTRSIEAVALLRKAPARERSIDVKYVGFDIDKEFVLGYGLDYNGLGRNLNEIYKALDYPQDKT
ncbi:MAG TPA: hypoxanthine phosphoribosyltransferase [Cyclobacteriaceae bacterium]|jgi:hypoxanthine phosphoribosyltransferase|nr:MAG: hypoxanthine phosphoribosyltransferase [Bacteroidota bacterium]